MYNSANTYFNYFSYQGKKYALNTVVRMNHIYVWNHQIGYLDELKMVQLVESYLDWQGIHRWTYALWWRNGHVLTYTTSRTPEEMIATIWRTPDTFPPVSTKAEYYKDSESPAVMKGWVYYIIAMAACLLFKDCITGWVGGSLCFFLWRRAKLRKPDNIKYGFNVYDKVREWNGEW